MITSGMGLTMGLRLGAPNNRRSLLHQALSAIRRAGGTVLAAGAATPVLGPELVTNGDFATADGWSLGVSWSIGSGAATKATGGGSVSRTASLVAGKTYLFTFTVTSVANAGSGIGCSLGNGTSYGAFTTTGTFTQEVVAGASADVKLFARGDESWRGSVDNVSVREVLSYTYGNPPVRNYFDSAGTDILDSVTQVDQPVGLTLDAAGSVGPELAGLSTPWQSYGTGISLVGGQMVFTATPAGQFAMRGTPLTANKTYELEITIPAISGGGLQMLVSGGAGTDSITTPGTYRGIYKATGADGPYLWVASGTVTAVVTVASCREVIGNHATQPTTGSKPTLRRGLVNQLLWSGDFSNAAWTKIGASIEPNAATTPDGYLAGRLVENTANNLHGVLPTAFPAVTSGAVYTIATVVKAAGRTAIYVRDNGSTNAGAYFNLSTGAAYSAEAGVVAATSSPLGDGWHLCVVTYTTTSAACNAQVRLVSTGTTVSYTGDGVSGAFVHRCGLFTGTVTAQQILAAGGIPLTTTAPASSVLGKYWWQFDPAAPGDFLQTGITTGNEGWICAGVTPSLITSYRSILHSGVLGGEKGVWLLMELGAWGFGTLNGSANQSTPQIAATTSPTVVAGGWNASSVLLEVNNQQVSGARSGDCTSVNALRIGLTSAGSFPFSGNISAVVICPTLPSAADRALIRAWVAKQQGQTL